ncbi:MAG: YlbF family regulator [Chloroflexi bacterium]|nr:YlbF family regulator [Chloroflexota bacterium]
MSEIKWNDLEVVPRSAVMQAAKQFAEALGETPQFKEFEQSYFAYRQDEETKNAIQEFQKKQASLKALLMLNAVSQEDQQELHRLQDRFYHQPSVLRYTQAQVELIAISQEIGDILSKAIGLDFGSSCRTGGCCG